VLTHHPRNSIEMQGGTTFHFVSDGIESALAQARDVAGDFDVAIGGGALTVREYLAADLIDEMHLAVVPVLLGSGERLFEGVDLAGRFEFEPVQSSSAVAHFIARRAW
jgi:dihydrofolate reductase